MDSQQTKTFTSMLDQQLSQNMAKRGIGLADVLVRQLSAQKRQAKALEMNGRRWRSAAARPTPRRRGSTSRMLTRLQRATDGHGPTAPAPAQPASRQRPDPGKPHVRAFQEKLGAHAAEEAEAGTGVPAKFMLGQAALETGWGKRMIRNADGSNSNNLFGIKAGPGWKGKVATAVTTEYVNGQPHTKVKSSAPTTRRPTRSRITRACWPTIRATKRCWSTAATPRPSPTACSAPATRPTRSTRPSCRASSSIRWLNGNRW
jgi:flagellar protein FlgJ